MNPLTESAGGSGLGLRSWLLLALLTTSSTTQALELGGRIKAFGQFEILTSSDVRREDTGGIAYDENVDVRVTLREKRGRISFAADLEATAVHGDAHQRRMRLQQNAANDGRRWQDLTANLSRQQRSSLRARFDRLHVSYRAGRWNLLAGRQALSLGNGLVFQPFDLFNPFAPTETDRDFKAGDDLVQVQRLFENGSDLQLIAVGHRNIDGQRSGAEGSFGAQWHGFVGVNEVNLLAGRHYADRVYGIGLSRPVGPALLRTDVVATDADIGGWRVSGVLNADVSFMLGQRNAYLFGEYYYNGFGLADTPADITELNGPLLERIARGDVFTTSRHYLSTGLRLEWHPLWTQNVLLISSLQDGSQVLQSTLVWIPDDHQLLELALTAGIGGRGSEFGGIPIIPESPFVSSREVPTTGGGTRMHVRYIRYF